MAQKPSVQFDERLFANLQEFILGANRLMVPDDFWRYELQLKIKELINNNEIQGDDSKAAGLVYNLLSESTRFMAFISAYREFRKGQISLPPESRLADQEAFDAVYFKVITDNYGEIVDMSMFKRKTE